MTLSFGSISQSHDNQRLFPQKVALNLLGPSTFPDLNHYVRLSFTKANYAQERLATNLTKPLSFFSR